MYPPLGQLYNLLEVKPKALWEYRHNIVHIGTISYSKSLAIAPVLYIPKLHQRGLWLCVDYQGLN
jgi:hypothetical protein